MSLEAMLDRLLPYKPHVILWPWQGRLWAQLQMDGAQVYNGPLSGLAHAARNWLLRRAEEEIAGEDSEEAAIERAMLVLTGPHTTQSPEAHTDIASTALSHQPREDK